jgi:hypothetical protein
MISNKSKFSYRDPDGYVLNLDNSFFRVVYQTFSEDLEIINRHNLLNDKRFIKHTQIPKDEWPLVIRNWINENEIESDVLCIFEIEKIHCITYPWEWTLSMFKEAALLTLEIQKVLIPIGLTLKDASYFNVQFINGRPIFIDLLSLKKADIFYPWHAYGQFLKHFIFPLVLFKYNSFNTLTLLRSFSDGIDVSTISSLLPFRSYFNIYEFLNIHLLNSLKNQGNPKKIEFNTTLQKQKAEQLVSFSRSYINSIDSKKLLKRYSAWRDYPEQNEAIYSRKKEMVFRQMLSSLPRMETCVDLGANTGVFSQILIEYVDSVISVEQDLICCKMIREKILLMDLKNKNWSILLNDLIFPSNSSGWMNRERLSLFDRINSSLVISLALIHHLYFKGSLYFDEVALMFNRITEKILIIEFIEADDDKVQLLAEQNSTRLSSYNKENFIQEFNNHFDFVEEVTINQTRSMFLFEKQK